MIVVGYVKTLDNGVERITLLSLTAAACRMEKSMATDTETKRGPGRPPVITLETLLTTFATLKQVTVPILVETLELKPDTAYGHILRAMRSQWVKRVAHGKYALSAKGEQKAAQFV